MLARRQERRVRGDQPVAAGEQARGLGRALGGGAEDGGGGIVALLGEGRARAWPGARLGSTAQRPSPAAARRVDERAQLGGVLEEVVEALEGGGHVRVVAGEALPVVELALDRDARAGDVRDRELLVAAGLPGVEGEGEGAELGAARVELEAEQVVAEDGRGGGLCAVRPSSSIRILRSMSAAATRKWPEPMQGSMTVISAARSGQPSKVPAAGVPSSRKRRYSHSLQERAVGMAARPPGAERVLEQEADHVVLGEELGHRRQVGAADLVAGLVDLLLALGLPELVDPAEGVVGRNSAAGRAARIASRRVRSLGGEADLVGGIVGPEDARAASPRHSGRRGPTGRARLPRRRARRPRPSRPAAPPGWRSRSFSARNRANSIRCHCSYAISSTRPSMPERQDAAAERAAAGAKGGPEIAVCLAQRRRRGRRLDAEDGDRGPGALLGRVAGADDRPLEVAAELRRERGHLEDHRSLGQLRLDPRPEVVQVASTSSARAERRRRRRHPDRRGLDELRRLLAGLRDPRREQVDPVLPVARSRGLKRRQKLARRLQAGRRLGVERGRREDGRALVSDRALPRDRPTREPRWRWLRACS